MNTFIKQSHERILGSISQNGNRTKLRIVLCLYEFGEFDKEAYLVMYDHYILILN